MSNDNQKWRLISEYDSSNAIAHIKNAFNPELNPATKQQLIEALHSLETGLHITDIVPSDYANTPKINESDISNYLTILDTAIGILQDTVDDSDEDINILRVGTGIGRVIELINIVHTEMLKKHSVNTNAETNASKEEEEEILEI